MDNCTQVLEVNHLDNASSDISGNSKIKVGILTIDGLEFNIYRGLNVIGRDEQSHITINNNAISNRHAVIEVEDWNTHLLYDVGSTNKTKLGKVLLKPNVRYNLEDNDIIMFANVKANYQKVEKLHILDLDDNIDSDTESESMLNCGSIDPAPDLATRSHRRMNPSIDPQKNGDAERKLNESLEITINNSLVKVNKSQSPSANVVEASTDESTVDEDLFMRSQKSTGSSSSKHENYKTNKESIANFSEDIFNHSAVCSFKGDNNVSSNAINIEIDKNIFEMETQEVKIDFQTERNKVIDNTESQYYNTQNIFNDVNTFQTASKCCKYIPSVHIKRENIKSSDKTAGENVLKIVHPKVNAASEHLDITVSNIKCMDNAKSIFLERNESIKNHKSSICHQNNTTHNLDMEIKSKGFKLNEIPKTIEDGNSILTPIHVNNAPNNCNQTTNKTNPHNEPVDLKLSKNYTGVLCDSARELNKESPIGNKMIEDLSESFFSAITQVNPIIEDDKISSKMKCRSRERNEPRKDQKSSIDHQNKTTHNLGMEKKSKEFESNEIPKIIEDDYSLLSEIHVNKAPNNSKEQQNITNPHNESVDLKLSKNNTGVLCDSAQELNKEGTIANKIIEDLSESFFSAITQVNPIIEEGKHSSKTKSCSNTSYKNVVQVNSTLGNNNIELNKTSEDFFESATQINPALIKDQPLVLPRFDTCDLDQEIECVPNHGASKISVIESQHAKDLKNTDAMDVEIVRSTNFGNINSCEMDVVNENNVIYMPPQEKPNKKDCNTETELYNQHTINFESKCNTVYEENNSGNNSVIQQQTNKTLIINKGSDISKNVTNYDCSNENAINANLSTVPKDSFTLVQDVEANSIELISKNKCQRKANRETIKKMIHNKNNLTEADMEICSTVGRSMNFPASEKIPRIKDCHLDEHNIHNMIENITSDATLMPITKISHEVAIKQSIIFENCSSYSTPIKPFNVENNKCINSVSSLESPLEQRTSVEMLCSPILPSFEKVVANKRSESPHTDQLNVVECYNQSPAMTKPHGLSNKDTLFNTVIDSNFKLEKDKCSPKIGSNYKSIEENERLDFTSPNIAFNDTKQKSLLSNTRNKKQGNTLQSLVTDINGSSKSEKNILGKSLPNSAVKYEETNSFSNKQNFNPASLVIDSSIESNALHMENQSINQVTFTNSLNPLNCELLEHIPSLHNNDRCTDTSIRQNTDNRENTPGCPQDVQAFSKFESGASNTMSNIKCANMKKVDKTSSCVLRKSNQDKKMVRSSVGFKNIKQKQKDSISLKKTELHQSIIKEISCHDDLTPSNYNCDQQSQMVKTNLVNKNKKSMKKLATISNHSNLCLNDDIDDKSLNKRVLRSGKEQTKVSEPVQSACSNKSVILNIQSMRKRKKKDELVDESMSPKHSKMSLQVINNSTKQNCNKQLDKNEEGKQLILKSCELLHKGNNTMRDASNGKEKRNLDGKTDRRKKDLQLLNSSVPSNNDHNKSTSHMKNSIDVKVKKKDNCEEVDVGISKCRSKTKINTTGERAGVISDTESVSSALSHRSGCSAMESPRRLVKRGLKVLFTGLSNPILESNISKLGGEVIDCFNICSVLVTDKVRRTVKFICVLGQGKPIVSPDWIIQSWRCSKFLDPMSHLLNDAESELKYNFRLSETISKAKIQPLLTGYTIHATRGVKLPLEDVKCIVESCGGLFLPKVPSKWSPQTIIISHEDDKTVWRKLKVKNVTPPIVNIEMLLLGVLQHSIDIESHRIK